MKTIFSFRILFAVVSLAAGCAAGIAFMLPARHVSAASSPRQQWEYMRYQASYSITRDGALNYQDQACSVDDEKVKCEGPAAFLPRFGAQGWELIQIMPESTITGAFNAGVTTANTYVFKRPKL